jgi:hypothetical protein
MFVYAYVFLSLQAEAAIAKLGASRKNDLVVTGKKAPVAQEDSEDDSEVRIDELDCMSVDALDK